MNHLSVRQRILLSFGAATLLLILFGVFAYVNLKSIENRSSSISVDSLPGLYHASLLEAACLEGFELDQNWVLAQPREDLKKESEDNAKRLSAILGDYKSTVFKNSDKKMLAEMEEALLAYSKVREKAQTAHQDASLSPEAQRLSKLVKDNMEGNKRDADDDLRTIAAAIAAAKSAVWISLAAGLIIAVLCGYLLVQAITKPLSQLVGAIEVMRTGDFTRRLSYDREDEFGAMAQGFNRMADDLTALVSQVQRSGIQVNSSSTELAVTSKQQETTANEVAATTAEIGATSKEISATSQELGKAINEVSEVAEHTAQVANAGQSGLARMEETMRNVMEAAASINAKLAVVNDKAGNISQVVTTITKVADQTNLLSLNAAIEAEKAGEQGRGFSVVATEIRRLADQTAVASSDIEQMVKEMQSAVSAGVMGMDKFSEEVRRGTNDVKEVVAQLGQIIQQVQALTPRFEEVNEGMQSQAVGAQQISEALSQLGEAARQTAESLRQSNLSTEQLNEASRGLQTSVARFKLRAS
jgi:methyl-accepting chemotaxis protein WspA